MPTNLDFKVKQIQFALFPKAFNLIDKLKIASEFKDRTSDFFKSDPTILPLPTEAPGDMPRIIFKSDDNIYSCNIALTRIDFFQAPNEYKEFNEVKDNYLDKIKLIYNYFINVQKLAIGRIGFVVDLITTLSNSANDLLKNNALKDGFYFKDSNKIKNISLIFNEKDNISKWEISRLIKIESLRKISDPSDDKILRLHYDINTPIEKKDEYNLSINDIEELVKKFSEEIIGNLNNFIKID